MDCLRFVELASSETVPREDVASFQDHQASCGECAAAKAALETTRTAVPEVPPQALVGFVARVRSRAARDQLSRAFSPTRSALSAAALAASAAAIVVVTIHRNNPPGATRAPATPPAVVATTGEEDSDLLGPSDDPLATLSDEELRTVEDMIGDDADVDEETGI
jgi:hypothetical protein